MRRDGNSGEQTFGGIVERFRRARRDPSLAVLEGFHPLKHALRFEAEVLEAATPDPDRLSRLAQTLAPDIAGRLAGACTVVDRKEFGRLAPVSPPTGVIALARRPTVSVPDLLQRYNPNPIVVLENPARLGNLGAAVRVSAAGRAMAVIAIGGHDPWHPEALRGGAGLQFALPVARVDALPACDRPLVALDPAGEPLRSGMIPPGAFLAFGSERRGLSPGLMARADIRLRIPMREGVSSLNLASAVAIALYARVLSGEPGS
ncbi:MAG TPA: TrmH family RNA methyltransferase [Gemmatimonadota bacterium]|nr:TrmH family RNA methyltransferase [Gemmatimonadota bacterium]